MKRFAYIFPKAFIFSALLNLECRFFNGKSAHEAIAMSQVSGHYPERFGVKILDGWRIVVNAA